ncbi:protein SOSEKI 2-like [Wolffia australiana]
MDPAVSGGAAAARLRRSLETSPDRARGPLPAKPRALRKAQIVYYLCRNGQLEHPHFMEIILHYNHQLRLKDVLEKMVSLRGKGMPWLFSWSCKRSYKNGYVWNDLSENDIIHPADGASEYILKGSEMIESCSEGFRRLHGGEEAEEEETVGRRLSRSRASELVLDDGDISPPSSSSSEKTHPPAPAAPRRRAAPEPGDSADEQVQLPRSSVLLQLIACGASAAGKGRAGGSAKAAAARNGCNSGRKSGATLHKDVLRRAAAAAEDEYVEDFSSMPLNPNPRREEKEYFSGSIVDSFTEMSRVVAGPCLKKSSSYNEERSAKDGLGDVYELAGERKGERGAGAKCATNGGRKRAVGSGEIRR